MGRVLRCSALLLFGLCLPLHAHNGAAAIAVPVQEIVVDGDFADWPETVPRYPIALLQAGNMPVDDGDFTGSLRFAYNAEQNSLYIAIEITDESVVVDTSAGGDWDNQDGCELYVDLLHWKGDTEVGQYGVQGETYRTYGTGVQTTDTEVAVYGQGGERRYEWRVDVGRKAEGRLQLRPRIALGVNINVRDMDGDGSFSVLGWGARWGGNTADLGDVVLGGDASEWGRLAGKAVWESGLPLARHHVEVQSLQDSTLWIAVSTDRQGHFAVDLPPGTYAVEVLGEIDTVDIAAAGNAPLTTTVAIPRGIAAAPSAGKTVRAGPGQTHAAGSGTRKGHWRTFGIADGLPPASVSAIFQDRQGRLWFGTGRHWGEYEEGDGVVCYDGTEFVRYTTADGLSHDTVYGIAEDNNGHLWFATWGGGLSRYDGETFTHFTTVDGLASDELYAIAIDGNDHVWLGSDKGLSRYDGERFVNFTTADGLVDDNISSLVEDAEGDLWFGYWRGMATRYDGETMAHFTNADGLPASDGVPIKAVGGKLWFAGIHGLRWLAGDTMNPPAIEPDLFLPHIISMTGSASGDLWLGTFANGALRYDGVEYVRYTTEDGLGSDIMLAVFADRQGGIWCGNLGGGVSYYEAPRVLTLTTEDGLKHNQVFAVLEDRQGRVWAGLRGGLDLIVGEQFHSSFPIWGIMELMEDRAGNVWISSGSSGVYRYDGEQFEQFTADDCLLNSADIAVAKEDRAGNIWLGSFGSGVSRYDGEQFVNYTVDDGLVHNVVNRSIVEDRQGRLWFATIGGVSRYDGEQFVNFTTADGLVHNDVRNIVQDRQGHMWFGTWGGGISRFDGEQWQTYTTADGLSHDRVLSFAEDEQGRLWIGTWGGGVNIFDGFVFQHLLKADGLGSDVVQRVTQGTSGDMWIATEGGVTRYRPATVPPTVRLTNVTTDRAHGPVETVQLSTDQDYLLVEFQGASLTTSAARMVYVYRLQGRDSEWQQMRRNQIEYDDLPAGDYVFEVKAVDQDLNYSPPVALRIAVRPPYGQFALIGGLGLALTGLVLATGYSLRKRRDLRRAEQALLQELEEELQTARALQMSLMPTQSPDIAGLDIAGRCETVNHVGGDFFQYFARDGKFALCLADVTGHAMEAAVPVMMFSGVLKSEMAYGHALDQLFAKVNDTIYSSLDRRTFVCFAMGDLDLATYVLRLANGGCPYPYHYRAATGQVVEIEIDAYPLGVRAEAAYAVEAVQLAAGDYMIFCSDGLIEASNAADQIFGFEQLAETLRAGCTEGLSAEALIDRLIGAVRVFMDGAPQEDDMTCVVLRV